MGIKLVLSVFERLLQKVTVICLNCKDPVFLQADFGLFETSVLSTVLWRINACGLAQLIVTDKFAHTLLLDVLLGIYD